jgi:hypothetical protein
MRLGYTLGCRLLAGTVLAGSMASSAWALSFNFTQVAGDTLSTSEAAAFSTAAAAWSAVLTDNITVNVNIGFRSLGAGILGQTSQTFVVGSAAAIRTALTADAKTSADTLALASLNALPPSGSIAVTHAEAKALGLTQPGSDGTIEFSTNFPFSDSRNPDGSIANGTYDLIGVAEHEIAHLLGFDSSIDAGAGNAPTLLDEFRFSAPNSRATVAGAAYFSLNDGASAVLDGSGSAAAFSTGSGDQASHWLRGVNGLMIPAYNTNQVINLTPLDVVALDVIGYDATVPEPQSIAVLMVGLVGLLAAGRRRA